MGFWERRTPGDADRERAADEQEPPPAAYEQEPEAPPAANGGADAAPPRTMLPARERRRLRVERLLMRLVATAGIVGIGVALGAILVSQDVGGWIVGLVVALCSVILSAVLWSSRQL